MKTRLRAGLAALLALTMSGQAFALGTASYSSELISTRSLGQGGTGVAGVQDDPIVGYTNPAAMTSMKGTQMAAGLAYVNASPTFTNDQNQAVGARATSVAIPSFGATTLSADGRWAFGLAAVTPYGLETHWNGDSPLRYAATDARLRLVDVTPSVAYKVCDGFSVGAGVDYYNAIEGALSKKVDSAQINGDLVFAGTGNAGLAAAAAGASKDANSRLNGNGDGWGYHVGTTIRPNEHHQIGIVYHSNVKIRLDGNVQMTDLNGAEAGVFGGSSFQTDASAPLFIPQNVQLGYAYMPNDRWQFEADAAWYDWYAARQLGVVVNGYSAANPAAAQSILNSGDPQKFNPRKTVNFGVGANYKHSDALQMRGGFYYQAAALPESAFAPAFVDLPRYALTFGAGWKMTDALTADVAYDAVFFHGRHVTATNPTGDAFSVNKGYSGNFSSFANIIALSLTYRTDARF